MPSCSAIRRDTAAGRRADRRASAWALRPAWPRSGSGSGDVGSCSGETHRPHARRHAVPVRAACSAMAASSRSAATRCPAAASSPPSPTSPHSATPRPNSSASTRRWSSASPSAPRMLEAAKREAERANDAKSALPRRGQPRPAAAAACRAPVHPCAVAARRHPQYRGWRRQIDGALDSTTDLLAGLLDISRLDAGGLVPEPRAFPLADVLEPLAAEFRRARRRNAACSCAACHRAPGCAAIRNCCAACCRTSSPTPCATPMKVASCLAAGAMPDSFRIEV